MKNLPLVSGDLVKSSSASKWLYTKNNCGTLLCVGKVDLCKIYFVMCHTYKNNSLWLDVYDSNTRKIYVVDTNDLCRI